MRDTLLKKIEVKKECKDQSHKVFHVYLSSMIWVLQYLRVLIVFSQSASDLSSRLKLFKF